MPAALADIAQVVFSREHILQQNAQRFFRFLENGTVRGLPEQVEPFDGAISRRK